ncbi:ABC transporter permease [uncultured Tateyamaria sp.]|uniref:ABC transporter permease n=1 Tax=uncultured Tateyamaria sp. TaxID=455651 RepID=UPI00261F8A3A|nr:ABC transporter permease [uncultured Tateyamaria sp.]
MMASIRQTVAMSRATLLSVPRRMAISLSMVGSIMLVVCVLSGFLSMARGFEITLQSAGSPDVAVILGGGTREEVNSEIPSDIARSIMAKGNDIGVLRDASGTPLLSRELVVPVEYRTQLDTSGTTLALRGMEASGLTIRSGVTLSSGRLVSPGAREILVGEQLATKYPGLDIGNDIRLGPVVWTVVGHFSAGGSAFESEIWGDFDAVASAFNRIGEVQSLRLKLTEPTAILRLTLSMSEFADAQLMAFTEADLYAGQSEATAQLIRMFGWPISLLMAIGATAGALNTMMSSLSDRTVEIGTVRALGFNRLSAFLSTWLEAFLLSAVGASLGLTLSWLALNGWQTSTMGANGAQMAFRFVVNADVMTITALVGVAIGAVGGALPAFAAARLPVATALRARG